MSNTPKRLTLIHCKRQVTLAEWMNGQQASISGRRQVSNVGDYQSAIQLVVGANLAFFTFPELRQTAPAEAGG
jgi:hypothetical protein